MPRRLLPSAVVVALVVAVVVPVSALAAGSAGASYDSWRSCLANAFTLRAAMSGSTLAADAALRECRGPEAAYLADLTASPLLDEDDVQHARPALLVRARTWLLTARAGKSL